MTPTITFVNPPPAPALPPLPGPGDVRLGWVPVTPRRRPKPTYPTGNIHKQRRQKGRTR